MYLHSSAILFNSFAMTLLMLICGLAGATELTADIAIVQASTLTFFFAFSANARNLIFADSSGSVSHSLLRARLMLILPLAVFSFIFSSLIGSVDAMLAIVLIARRSAEWFGEVFLSSYERHSERRPVMLAITAEILSLSLVFLSLFLDNLNSITAMTLWAAAPLVAIAGGKLAQPLKTVTLIHDLAKLAPNFGSTTIIGIAVYVFRLSIVILVGRAAAGDLFTAFIIGGMIPTIYNSSIGPSLALRNDREESLKKLPVLLKNWFLPALLVIGISVTALSIYYSEIMTFLGKNHFFWTAAGLSLSGGAIMMPALQRRIKMLQQGRNIEIFGVDVLSNTFIAISVPFIFHLLGAQSLAGLYLFNALITLSLYWSAERINMREKPVITDESRKLLIIAFVIVIPFFLQLSGGVFRSETFIFDTGRSIFLLPIPISVLGLVGGILLLGRFRETYRSLSFFFFLAILLVVGALFYQEKSTQADRLVLMAQYLLPMLGLVLGEMYGSASSHKEFEKMCLVVVGLMVPLQLICSWLQGMVILSPHLYFFSIHQHMQYVPIIMAVCYGIALISLWGEEGRIWRIVLIIMLPWISVYAMASLSLMAIVTLVIFIFAFFRMLHSSIMSGRIIVIISVVLALVACYYMFLSKPYTSTNLSSFGINLKYSSAKSIAALPHNFTDRFEYWKFYGKGIFDGPMEFFFGHSHPPDPNRYRSAHNYYLDLFYNFGFAGLIPLVLLLVYIACLAYSYRSKLFSEQTLYAIFIGVFILFVLDNSLKVGLRHPYPGIFSFFLLGLLLARFSKLVKKIS